MGDSFGQTQPQDHGHRRQDLLLGAQLEGRYRRDSPATPAFHPVLTLHGTSALKTLLCTENWGGVGVAGGCCRRGLQDPTSTALGGPRLCRRQHLWRRALQGLPALRWRPEPRRPTRPHCPGGEGRTESPDRDEVMEMPSSAGSRRVWDRAGRTGGPQHADTPRGRCIQPHLGAAEKTAPSTTAAPFSGVCPTERGTEGRATSITRQEQEYHLSRATGWTSGQGW